MKKYLSIAAAVLSLGITVSAGGAFAQTGDESGANAIGQPPRYENGASANANNYGAYYAPYQYQYDQYEQTAPMGATTNRRYLQSRSSRMEVPRSGYYR